METPTMPQGQKLLSFIVESGASREQVQQLLANGDLLKLLLEAEDLSMVTRDEFRALLTPELPPTPSWRRSPEAQLEKASRLWPDAQLLGPPSNFEPRTTSEVLLLHVPRPFDELLERAEIPGYTTIVNIDVDKLRLLPYSVIYQKPIWLAFDPEHGTGKPPSSFMDRDDMAASVIFSAMMQFPDWPLTWERDGVSSPNLSGYRIWEDECWNVPYLRRWKPGQQLLLNLGRANNSIEGWASPTARMC